jgi:hypothetical protein
MFNEGHYIPILKAKMGEFGAVRELSASQKVKLTPFFDVPPVPWDYVEDTPTKPLEDHLGAVSKKVDDYWGQAHPFFIDLFAIELEERTNAGQHPLDCLLEDLIRRGLAPIPATGLDRDDAYQRALANAVPTLKRGLCLRLLIEDIERYNDENLLSELDELIQLSRLSPSKMHLLLDLRDITAGQIESRVQLIERGLRHLPYMDEWDTVSLSASGFPLDLSEQRPDTDRNVLRAELCLWEQVRERCTNSARIPTFGDYAVAHPDLQEIDPRAMQMSANIRYTTERDWLLIKGRGVRKYRFSQFHGLSRLLVQRPEYRGPAFSWGDDYIDRCAREEAGPGNATTWRKVGTNHHLTMVVRERDQERES